MIFVQEGSHASLMSGGTSTQGWCAVHEKRAELVELFQHILDHAEVFNRETVHCASGHFHI